MMMTIRLYSHMGRDFGRVHRADLATGSVAEAVRYLRANFPTIDKYLMGAKRKGVGFAIFRGKENLDKTQLDEPCHGDDIRIAPVIIGSKNGGLFSIVLGAALIALSFVPGMQAFSPYLLGTGVSMIAGGVIQMLTPRPKGLAAKDRPENTPSYAFNGPVNTTAQGHCVPVLYGEGWVGSAVISAGMDIKDDVRAPIGGTASPGGGTGGVGGNMGRLGVGSNVKVL